MTQECEIVDSSKNDRLRYDRKNASKNGILRESSI